MNRVLVTGGTGVTGTALVRYLLQQNIEVVAIVRPGSFREKYLPEDDRRLTVLHYNLTDILDAEEEIRQCGRIDVFFHLAWEGSTIADKKGSRDNMELQSRNIVCTVDAAELCYKIDCPVFVMTGSQAEYGPTNDRITEETPLLPANGYGNAKLCAENMTRIMCKKYGVRHIVARLFSVYGPYDGTNSLINTSVLKVLKGERPKYTEGIQRWNYLYSFDAAKALYLLALKGEDGEAYNVASDMEKPLREYIEEMHETVNPDIPAVFGEIPYGVGPMQEMICDISKLKKTTDFKPEYDFKRGIKEIAYWCLASNEEYVGSVENMGFYLTQIAPKGDNR